MSNNDLQSVTVTHHTPTCFIMVMIIIMDRHVLDPWIPWIEHPNDHPNSRPTEAARRLLFATPTPQVLQATLRWRGQNSALRCSASLSKACNALGWRWQSLAATGRRLRWASGHSRGLSSGPSLGWLCLCVLVTLVVLRISTSFGSCNWARLLLFRDFFSQLLSDMSQSAESAMWSVGLLSPCAAWPDHVPGFRDHEPSPSPIAIPELVPAPPVQNKQKPKTAGAWLSSG